MIFIGFEFYMSFYLQMSLYKMYKHYKWQSINYLSSLFHHGLIKILFVSHLLQIGDSWEGFLSWNGFTQVDDTVSPHLIANPDLDRPVTKIQVFNSLDGYEFNEPTSIVNETPFWIKN